MIFLRSGRGHHTDLHCVVAAVPVGVPVVPGRLYQSGTVGLSAPPERNRWPVGVVVVPVGVAVPVGPSICERSSCRSSRRSGGGA